MKNLVVSVHDVSPLTQSITASLLAELKDLGIDQTSLLVIPDHHHRAPVREDLKFQDWLTTEVQKGHEPVLHGYFHARERQERERWADRAITEIYTAGEGEFFDLSEQEADQRLRNGLADLSFLPRPVHGFIAPAWLLGDEAEKAVRALGFRYTTRIGTVHAFDKVIRSRSLVWSTRAHWRLLLSLGWNGTLAKLVNKTDLVRVGIHPPDYTSPAVWKQIRRLLTGLRTNRAPLSYENYLAQAD